MADTLSEIDRKIVKILLQNEGNIHSQELSNAVGIPLSTLQRRRKRIENQYLLRSYSLNIEKFGWRRINLLIATEGGVTSKIGKEILKRPEVTFVARTIGEHTIDLQAEVFVKDNSELLNLLEDVKAMNGVKDVVWTEVIETIGRKQPPNHVMDELKIA